MTIHDSQINDCFRNCSMDNALRRESQERRLMRLQDAAIALWSIGDYCWVGIHALSRREKSGIW